MPTGIIINSLSIILGGIAGGLFGDYLRDDFKENLNLIFGLASMVMGISAIMNMVNMPAVIFAVVIGTIIGLALKFGNLINKGAGLMEKGLSKITPSKQTGLAHDEFYAQLLTVMAASRCEPSSAKRPSNSPAVSCAPISTVNCARIGPASMARTIRNTVALRGAS